MSGHDELPIDVAREIDRRCLEFEVAWRSGKRPRIEEYLQQWDAPAEHRPAFLAELLRIELDGLRHEELQPGVHQYVVRFPDDEPLVRQVFADWSRESTAHALTATFVPHTAELDVPLPEQIGRYQIRKVLGRGAFGVVYLAYDPKLDCPVAIKQLSAASVQGTHSGDNVDFSRIVESLLREARLAAKLRQYQGIVAVLDVLTTATDEEVGDIYFVQEYVDGASLKELACGGPLSPRETARILQRVAEAMHHVHEHGIYHRDLKPGNIILNSRRDPFVVDFGLAVDTDVQRTLRGEISGTLPYMAPEQVRGEVHLLDGRADIWAIGVMLYELLTGQRPFQGSDHSELFDRICHREPPPPRTINPQLPAELERICLKCLSKRMADRYATAGELSEELREWLADDETGPSPGRFAEEPSVRLVPRGLRSLTGEDAEVFPWLLPGARDRNGLPESINFWKQRIEEKDAEQTFRVGLLYGPSGCGKSSLVRAGLLPRLSHVVPVYIESTAADTEARLLGHLRKLAPQLSPNLSLPDVTMTLREKPELSGFRKVLLVFDQFEQWLQARPKFGREQLVEALRQCDGARVQALILVRDDFWMAVTRFLQELEVELIPGENLAAVDLFPLDHARHVLTEIGRAYGRFGEGEPTTPHREFIRRAVEGIAEDGLVVCVRLVVFGEMVKDKEWRPATLEQVGGTVGIGERFLDDVFTTAAANPRHRLHEHSARRVLQALLPHADTNIRGSMQSRAELLAVSDLQSRPEDFGELLRILDGELRLITPTDPGGLSGDGDAGGAYYQLAHDYLVPSLRNWLTRRQRTTRKGRAELLLSELAESWKHKPDPRRLPSPLEWMSMVGWTKRSQRSDAQRQMLRAATQRLARQTGAWVLALTLLLWLGYEVQGRFQSDAVVRGIATADARDLPLFVDDLKQYRGWSKPLLERGIVEARAQGEVRRERQLQLALTVLDPSAADALFNDLGNVPVEHLQVYADLLQPHARQLSDGLWERFRTAQTEDASGLRTAALLAALSPDDARWEESSELIAERLARVRTADAADWRKLMRPVSRSLAPALVNQMAERSNLSATQQVTVADLVSEYAADAPALLAQAVEYAAPDELPEFLDALAPHDEAGEVVRTGLLALEEGPPEVSVPLSDEIRSVIEAADGLVAAEGVLVLTLPRDAFAALNADLQSAGYTISSLRPYQSGDERMVAAVWRRDPSPCEVRWDLTVDDIDTVDRAMRAEAKHPVDFARYAIGAAADPSNMRWVVVWRHDVAAGSDTRFISAATLPDHDRLSTELPEEGFAVQRFEIWLASDGEPRCTALWSQGDGIDVETFADWRYQRAFGDLSPGILQTDLRVDAIPPAPGDRIGVFKHLRYYQDAAATSRSQTTKDSYLRSLSRYYSLMGMIDASQTILDELSPRQSQSSTFQRYCGLHFARAKDRERLLAHTAAYAELPSARQDVIGYLQLCAAAIAGDLDQCHEHLQTLTGLSESAYGRELLARAHAVVSGVEQDAASRTSHIEQCVALLRGLVDAGEAGEPEVLAFDVDFDGVRESEPFRTFLEESGLDRRFTASYATSQDRQSRQLYGLSLQDHRAGAARLIDDGYSPHVASVQRNADDDRLQCCSVWHRPVDDVDDTIQRAHRQANLLLAAARFGDPSGLLDALSSLAAADLRSYLILHAPAVLDPSAVRQMLEESRGTAETQALLLILGAVPPAARDPADPLPVREQLQELLDHEDAGVRSAVRWCRRQWKLPEVQPAEAPATELRNPVDQRLLVVDPPERQLMGSTAWETAREEQETQHWITIPRVFALADTETTNAQFYRFLQDERVRNYYGTSIIRFRSASADDDRPVIGVTWRDAALFCQWLSEQDPEIPQAQYCYPKIWESEAAGTQLPENYLQLTGYRLPTEAEWEWAARGGVQDAARFCGNDPQVLQGYAWLLNNSQGTPRPVATSRPNGFGFFDMLGSAIEWCDDAHDGYRRPLDGYLRSDAAGNEDLPSGSDFCAQRGGNSSQHHAEELRSANRWFSQATYRSSSTGFRVARTIRPR